MHARILLAEDDADLRATMVATLAAEGHQVDGAGDGTAAIDAVSAGVYDLVLLDVGLGAGPDGIEICRRLRTVDGDVYVIMLTARDTEDDVVSALEAGADDYVVKPVGIAELRSRVRAALRRLARPEERDAASPETLRHETLVLEPASQSVTVGAHVVATTRSEFAVLEALLRANGAVRSRIELLQAIYGDDAYRDPRSIDVHVHHLRSKLELAGGNPNSLATVRGAGYRLTR
jgi:DNA-binding response OmpR family regulator